MNTFVKSGILAVSVFGAVWLVDRSQMMDWVGETNLDVVFRVTDAITNDPIAGATLNVTAEFSEGLPSDFFRSPTDHMYHAEFTTDSSGRVEIRCDGVTCFGTKSFLLYTNTYHVCKPDWLVDGDASGYQSICDQAINGSNIRQPIRKNAKRWNEMSVEIRMYPIYR